jgi:hypothetical protein
MTIRPVKVTAHLVSPLALSPDGQAPFLDAICEWALSCKMRTIEECSDGRHALDRTRRRGQEVERPGMIPIPIERITVDGLPIPLCSSGIYAETPQRVEHYSRRFPTERASMLAPDERGVMQTSGGTFKSFRLPLRIVDTDRVVWFAAIRERPGRLRQLVSKVHGIGKKTSQGYGTVWRWEVEPIERDLSWWADGVLMRPLPASIALPSNARGYRNSFCGVTPPYWDRKFYREAVTPC